MILACAAQGNESNDIKRYNMILGDIITYGGEERIRTSDTRKRITVFETAAFGHSATSPHLFI
jgi:hypothetical protein